MINYCTMSITCNNTAGAIRSKYSNEYFSMIINDLDFIENKDEILSIYKKIKTLRPISFEEENMFINIIESPEFIEGLTLLISQLDIPDNKLKEFRTARFLDSIYNFITKCRVIDILNASDEYQITTTSESNSYFRIIEGWEKNLYLELLDEYMDYSLCFDIRAWKYKVINNKTNKVVLESKEKIMMSSRQDIDDLLFIESCVEWWNNFVIVDDNIITYSKDNTFHEWKFDYFILDKKTSQIYQIDKKTLCLKVRDFWWFSVIHETNWNILFHIRTRLINIAHKDEKEELEFTPGWLVLYNIESNKETLEYLHQRFYYIDNKIFIWLSFDCKYIELYEFKNKKSRTISISDFKWYNPKKDIETNFKKIVKKIKNQTS